jgi:hypothetical protein
MPPGLTLPLVYPLRDPSEVEERKLSLRRRLFAAVGYGITDSESLRDKVLWSMPEYWTLKTEPRPSEL